MYGEHSTGVLIMFKLSPSKLSPPPFSNTMYGAVRDTVRQSSGPDSEGDGPGLLSGSPHTAPRPYSRWRHS